MLVNFETSAAHPLYKVYKELLGLIPGIKSKIQSSLQLELYET